MAEIDFDGYDFREPRESGGWTAYVMNWIGAGRSVALVLGLAFWGYQLTIRDVTDVPVIRAIDGPARVQPADPGGQLAQHQGLAVNNVQSDGTTEGPTPQVILAPAPLDLAAEDAIRLGAPDEPTPEVQASLNTGPIEEAPATGALELVEDLAAGVQPLDETTEPAETRVALAIPARGFDPSSPGVKRSPRPVGKPQLNISAVQQTAAINAAVNSVVQSIADIDPSEVAAGTRLVQLGAYDDRETAIAEWDKLAAKFSEYLDGKGRLIQEAESGGRTFYRLRAVGFDDLNASRRFCAVLVASSAACIPVLAR